ncbi:MAG: 4Fe-4S cluster-binding domain-containing protein [Methanobacteriota archaeon]|nr:MAG: 4Fe-4S cluster-binding domain-containing protein [Euryarchaeota archaeon]
MKRGSAYTGELPRGCALCEKGAKLVLLVTGRCARRCTYCPLSPAKKGRDVFFANEKSIKRITEAIDEARVITALGTGITGGDPLLAIDRTARAIRALKREFGDRHHIHLYTSIAELHRVRRVAKAGLDEIRFHPPIGVWKRLRKTAFTEAVSTAKGLDMTVGLELPVIPGRKDDLSAAIAFAFDEDMDFVNLNELEFSETNWRALKRQGLHVRDDVSSGVAGSEQLAMELLRTCRTVPVHYCSSAFKDGVQLRNRMARRVKRVKKAYEIATDDSTLVKGVIETDDPENVMFLLRKEYDVPNHLMWHDREKHRLELAAWVLEEIASYISLDSYIVEEYPTADRLEVERRPIKRR